MLWFSSDSVREFVSGPEENRKFRGLCNRCSNILSLVDDAELSSCQWGMLATRKEIRDFTGSPEDDAGKFRIVRFVDMVMQSMELYEDRAVFGLQILERHRLATFAKVNCSMRDHSSYIDCTLFFSELAIVLQHTSW